MSDAERLLEQAVANFAEALADYDFEQAVRWAAVAWQAANALGIDHAA